LGDIALLGASGFARQVAWCSRRSGDHKIVAMIDETAPAPMEWDGTPIIPTLEGLAERSSDLKLLSAVGDPQLRRKWAEEHAPRFDFATVVDPSTVIAPDVLLGQGCIVFAGAILSTEVTVGDHSLLGFNVVISHETAVGSFTHLASGVVINGRSRVGHGCRIGAGAIILPRIEVGDGAVVGAGAVVTKNIKPGTKVAGMPARAIGFRGS
jgi:sugar O-acyltransferase (sialic acid O-acetyltransferase NeuD family)